MKDLEQVLGIGSCDLQTIRIYKPISFYEVVKYTLNEYRKFTSGYTKK